MDSSPQKAQPPIPPRCIKCLTILMPDATACPQCGRPAPPKSALTQQRDIDKTQFIRLAPGELLPEDDKPSVPGAPSRPVAGRRPLVLAMVLGLLAGALLLIVMVGLSRARH